MSADQGDRLRNAVRAECGRASCTWPKCKCYSLPPIVERALAADDAWRGKQPPAEVTAELREKMARAARVAWGPLGTGLSAWFNVVDAVLALVSRVPTPPYANPTVAMAAPPPVPSADPRLAEANAALAAIHDILADLLAAEAARQAREGRVREAARVAEREAKAAYLFVQSGTGQAWSALAGLAAALGEDGR